MKLSWLAKAYSRPVLSVGDLDEYKVGQGGLFLMCDQGSVVGLCVHDYKSLCSVYSGYDLCHSGFPKI